jgi:flagellar hook-basal body complex protein FliE
MSINDWMTLGGALLTGIGGSQWFNYRVNKRKGQAQASNEEATSFSKELKNTVDLVKFWRENFEELKTELKDASKAFNELILESDRCKINLSIVKSIVAETTCETLPLTKEKVAKI